MRQQPNGIAIDVVSARRSEVKRLRAEGYSQREIADRLLEVHTRGGTRLFTFVDENRALVDESSLRADEKSARAYATVRDDVAAQRKESQAEEPDGARLADDRYLLSERYRMLFRETREQMNAAIAANDRKDWNALCRTATDLAARIGRLCGIDTEKPSEVRGSETYRAWIDDSGIIHQERVESLAQPIGSGERTR